MCGAMAWPGGSEAVELEEQHVNNNDGDRLAVPRTTVVNGQLRTSEYCVPSLAFK